jgi:hypothetical protein
VHGTRLTHLTDGTEDLGTEVLRRGGWHSLRHVVVNIRLPNMPHDFLASPSCQRLLSLRLHVYDQGLGCLAALAHHQHLETLVVETVHSSGEHGNIVPIGCIPKSLKHMEFSCPINVQSLGAAVAASQARLASIKVCERDSFEEGRIEDSVCTILLTQAASLEILCLQFTDGLDWDSSPQLATALAACTSLKDLTIVLCPKSPFSFPHGTSFPSLQALSLTWRQHSLKGLAEPEGLWKLLSDGGVPSLTTLYFDPSDLLSVKAQGELIFAAFRATKDTLRHLTLRWTDFDERWFQSAAMATQWWNDAAESVGKAIGQLERLQVRPKSSPSSLLAG